MLDSTQVDLKGKETDTTRYPSTAWYQKQEVTFSDVLTFVRFPRGSIAIRRFCVLLYLMCSIAFLILPQDIASLSFGSTDREVGIPGPSILKSS